MNTKLKLVTAVIDPHGPRVFCEGVGERIDQVQVHTHTQGGLGMEGLAQVTLTGGEQEGRELDG